MTDPRAVVRHDGNHARFETFRIDASTITFSATAAGGSAVVGRAVSLSADDTVELAADDAPIIGRLAAVESDGFCSVQIGGFCTLPGGASATLTVNRKVVGALDAGNNRGFVKAVPETVTGGGPTAAEVTNAFRAARTRGIIINNDVTTAVVVDLG